MQGDGLSHRRADDLGIGHSVELEVDAHAETEGVRVHVGAGMTKQDRLGRVGVGGPGAVRKLGVGVNG